MIRMLSAFLLLLTLVFIGCDERFNTQVLPNPNTKGSVTETSYVEITPPFGGFETPTSVIVGNDQLIYVSDYDRNEVVMLDASGTILKRRHVPHPTAIAQNFKLDLYVCGETIAPNGRDTIGALYRIYLARFDTSIANHDTSFYYDNDLETVPMRIVHKEPERPKRRYVGLGFFGGNNYVLARTGPDNSSFVDPDNRVLLCANNDRYTPMGDLITRASGGTAITDINKLTGIAVFPASYDFIALQNNEGTAYGAIWLQFVNNASITGWPPKFDPSDPGQRTIDFIKPYRYFAPTAATVDRRRKDIFIIDPLQDSVFKFDRNGRFKAESFGKYRTKSTLLPGLNHPQGIAYSNDCTIYIADTGNHIIRRFKLSIQTSCF